MEKYHFKNENRKNNQLEIFRTPKRQRSFKNLLFNRKEEKTAFLKYLQYRQEKSSRNRKAASKEQKSSSYKKSKNFPSININIMSNKKKQMETISYYGDYENNYRIEKEKIISQLLKEKTELDIKNRELIGLTNYYQKLQNSNLTFKIIIEKILNINNEIIEDDDNNKDKDIIKDINIKNNNPKSIGERKINDLKKQIINVNKTIDEKNKLLEQTKKEEKIRNFIHLNKLLIEKNFELENLVSNGKELQYFHKDMDNKYDFLNYSIIKYKENIYSLKFKLKKNKKEIKFIENEIQNYLKEKEDIKINIEKLEKEIKNMEEEKIKNKEIIEKLKIEYENGQDMYKEKERDNYNLEEYNKLENNIIKIIDKNNNKIAMIKKENKNLENDIEKLHQENGGLIENVKLNLKNKQMIKMLEKDIKELKETIDKNKNEEKQLIITKKVEKEKIKKEIEEFEKAKIGLINKINELTKELSMKIKINNEKEEELNQKNQDYIDIKEKKYI